MTDRETRAYENAPRNAGDRDAARTVKVFVSYRRDDVPDATYRLVDALTSRFGRSDVFIDVDQIEIGAPFADVIEDWVARCDVLLAVIGERWLDARDENDARRLESPGDYVRLEIEAALLREIRVVPVLIHNALVPREAELPSSMAQLPRRNAIQLTRTHWDVDVARLVAAIERIAGERLATAGDSDDEPRPSSAGREQVPEKASPHSPLPASRDRPHHLSMTSAPVDVGVSAAESARRAGRSPSTARSRWRAAGLIAAAVVGAAIAVLASQRSNGTPPKHATQAAVISSRSAPGSRSASSTQPASSTEPGSKGATSTATAPQQQRPSVATVASATRASPLEVVGRYWEDIEAHRFGSAYSYRTHPIGEPESRFVAREEAEGIVNTRFTGRTASVNGATGRVNVLSLVTRDSSKGCREWTGWYAMSAATGRWLIAKANIQPHGCRG